VLLVPLVNGRMVGAAAAVANPNTVWRADPRVEHKLTLEVDAFGNVLKEAAIGYGRRYTDPNLPRDADRDAQSRVHITYTANAVSGVHVYRAPLASEQTVFEVTGLPLAPGRLRYQLAEILAAGMAAAFLSYERAPTPGFLEKRLIRHERTLFRRDDLTGSLALGALESLALPHEVYQLAFTPGLLAQEFQRNAQPLMADPAAVLGGAGTDRGGYVSSQSLKASGAFPATDSDDHWWRPSGRVLFSPGPGDTVVRERTYARQHFFVPCRFRDPFHSVANPTESVIRYDAYDLLLVETSDALGNHMTVGERNAAGNLISSGNDYRVLQPALLMDQNRNRTRVAFDALGGRFGGDGQTAACRCGGRFAGWFCR
jgi:hypothetical protein